MPRIKELQAYTVYPERIIYFADGLLLEYGYEVITA